LVILCHGSTPYAVLLYRRMLLYPLICRKDESAVVWLMLWTAIHLVFFWRDGHSLWLMHIYFNQRFWNEAYLSHACSVAADRRTKLKLFNCTFWQAQICKNWQLHHHLTQKRTCTSVCAVKQTSIGNKVSYSSLTVYWDTAFLETSIK
jgi:hypothetical protein